MLVDQVYVFGWSILTGAILGIIFDIFRGLRWEGIRDIWVYIQDIIFWLVSAVVIIASTFLINEGELRGYMLIGYLLGAGFYMLLFSKYILGTFKYINRKIRNTFKYFGTLVNKVKAKLIANKNCKKEKNDNKINFFHKKVKKLKIKQEI